MHAFFNGWRRKLGCATLLLALVFTGAWVRCRSICDVLLIPTAKRQYYLCTLDGALHWGGAKEPTPRWYVDSMSQLDVARRDYRNARGRWQHMPGAGLIEWNIPYWPIAIPLSLISAWLLLWKPRKPPATH